MHVKFLQLLQTQEETHDIGVWLPRKRLLRAPKLRDGTQRLEVIKNGAPHARMRQLLANRGHIEMSQGKGMFPALRHVQREMSNENQLTVPAR